MLEYYIWRATVCQEKSEDFCRISTRRIKKGACRKRRVSRDGYRALKEHTAAHIDNIRFCLYNYGKHTAGGLLCDTTGWTHI